MFHTAEMATNEATYGKKKRLRNATRPRIGWFKITAIASDNTIVLGTVTAANSSVFQNETSNVLSEKSDRKFSKPTKTIGFAESHSMTESANENKTGTSVSTKKPMKLGA